MKPMEGTAQDKIFNNIFSLLPLIFRETNAANKPNEFDNVHQPM